MTADQDSLPKLLLKQSNVWLDAGEVEFLWKQALSSHSLLQHKRRTCDIHERC